MMWDRVGDELFVEVKEIVVPEVVTKDPRKIFDLMGMSGSGFCNKHFTKYFH